MNRSTWILGVLVLIVLLLGACYPVHRYLETSAPASVAKLDDGKIATLDAYIADQQARNNVPGLAVGIVRDGQLVYEKGFGVANMDSGQPVNLETMFRVADITMIPTTIAVLQLVEQGKIDLDAPVTTYLPYFQLNNERYKDITVRNILEDKSGIVDGGDIAVMWSDFPVENDDGAVERFVRSMAQPSRIYAGGLAFAPGHGYAHSYVARIILGDVIQKVTGQTYEDYVQERIFTPLGMEHSALLLDTIDPALLASPHVYTADLAKVVVSDLVPFSRQFAASDNLYSSAEDMSRLMAALLNGGELDGARILSPESVALLWTSPGKAIDPINSFAWGYEHPVRIYGQYGMGGFIGEIAGHPVYHVFGFQHGYRANIMLCPDLKLGVVLMGNRGQNEREGERDELYAIDMVPDLMNLLVDAG